MSISSNFRVQILAELDIAECDLIEVLALVSKMRDVLDDAYHTDPVCMESDVATISHYDKAVLEAMDMADAALAIRKEDCSPEEDK